MDGGGPVPGTESPGDNPRDGESTHAAFGDIVRVPHDVSSQAEVTDLDQLALTDEHIPGCQVSVNTLGQERGELRLRGQLWEKNPLGFRENVCLPKGEVSQGPGHQSVGSCLIGP